MTDSKTLEIIAQVLKCPHCTIEWSEDILAYRIIRTNADGGSVNLSGETLNKVVESYHSYLQVRAKS